MPRRLSWIVQHTAIGARLFPRSVVLRFMLSIAWSLCLNLHRDSNRPDSRSWSSPPSNRAFQPAGKNASFFTRSSFRVRKSTVFTYCYSLKCWPKIFRDEWVWVYVRETRHFSSGTKRFGNVFGVVEGGGGISQLFDKKFCIFSQVVLDESKDKVIT